MDLKDKVVVITGASRGLGKSLAEYFTREGSKVVISSRNEKNLIEIADEFGSDYFVCNVTNEQEVLDLADHVANKFGKIDIWVNNAGIWLPNAAIEEMDMKRVHEMIEVNLFGTIYGSKAAIIHMKSLKSGTIINILSTSALEGRAYSTGYGASKYAAVGFAKGMKLEVKDHNINVLNIYPGGMKTNLFAEEKPKDYDDFMEPGYVVEKIINNLKQENPEEELIIRRPSQM